VGSHNRSRKRVAECKKIADKKIVSRNPTKKASPDDLIWCKVIEQTSLIHPDWNSSTRSPLSHPEG
jgi:hypothetical protein